jgi:hypothetical protein
VRIESNRSPCAAGAAADGAAVLARARAHAVAQFWRGLSSFVALGKAPRGWRRVPPDHPFVGRTGRGRLRLNGPG